MQYKISIIVPIYNVEKYIEQCVRSLFAQDMNNIQYIFVNDCTPDGSMNILEKVLEEYPEKKEHAIVFNKKKNAGLGAARKTGFERAEGEYVIHVDSDDRCELDMMSSLYQKAKETDSGIVVCDYFLNYPQKEEVMEQFIANTKEQNNHDILMGKLVPSVWNKLIKRSLYEKNNISPPENISYSEDRLLITKLCLVAEDILHIPRALIHYRQDNPSSLTKIINKKARDDLEICSKELKKFIKKRGMLDVHKESYHIGILAIVLHYSNGINYKKMIKKICPEADKLRYISKLPFARTSTRVIHSLTVCGFGFIAWSLLKIMKR